jgi:beta-mannosidase
VEVNGTVVGRSDNEHRRWRFDVTGLLRPTDNLLVIRFEAPLPHAERVEAVAGKQLVAGGGTNPWRPYNMIRKMACNFGWDWGPAWTTCGITRPIYLEAYNATRIAAVRPLVMAADAAQAKLDVHVRLNSDAPAQVRLLDPQGLVAVDWTELATQGGDTRSVSLTIRQPQLWWPAGHGGQPLYMLECIAGDPDHPLDRRVMRVGLRSVSLDTQPDAIGQRFCLVVNGRHIFIRGANWIPDDVFPCRVDESRYRQRIGQALDANMNLLRIWGGGTFETDTFYDLCDELGVLVWQDFLFACAAYHETEPFWSGIRAECRDAVERLAHHASIALWNGCNENLWGTYVWGPDWAKLRTEPNPTPWGLGYYFKMLPELLGELDPSRPYWPASPYSGDQARHPNDPDYGNCHIWNPWGNHQYVNATFGYLNFLREAPRFVSEFGFQGPADPRTLLPCLPDTPQDRQWDSDAMAHRNKQPDGQGRMDHHVRCWFDRPADFEDWLYLAQVVQARALELALCWYRSQSPRNQGIIIWQLNDCWPVVSWALVDAAGRCKPAWHAVRRAFEPRLLTIMPTRPMTGHSMPPLDAVLHNDHQQTWSAEVKIELMTYAGEVLRQQRQHIKVAPYATARIALEPAMHMSVGTFLVATACDTNFQEQHPFRGRSYWFAQADREIAYPDADFSVTAEVIPRGQRLCITARSLVRDLLLDPAVLPASAKVSEQVLTLLPGESREITVTAEEPLDPSLLCAASSWRCVNPFGCARA